MIYPFEYAFFEIIIWPDLSFILQNLMMNNKIIIEIVSEKKITIHKKHQHKL